MRTRSRSLAAAPGSDAALMLADELEQLAIGPPAALFRSEGGVPARVADEGAQLLQVGPRVVAREARRRRVLGDQLGAPALGAMQGERVAGVAELHRFDRFAHRRDVGRAHELADQLELAASRFVAANRAVLADRVDQGVFQAEAGDVL